MVVSDFKNLLFHILLPESIANYHAIEGYFIEMGYKIKYIRSQRRYNEYRDYWRVRLEYRPPEMVLLDILAGRFNQLEEKILKLKEIQLAK